MDAAPADRPAAGPAIGDDEFEAVRAALHRAAGIVLGDTKRVMVCSRLARRMRHHGSRTVADYLRVLAADPTGAERQEFVNALTTNKTDFFREPHHFDFLRDTVVPRARAGRRLRVWSAGCSTGEEPYTIALTLRDHCPAADGWDVKVLASDIDTAVLAAAGAGVYPAERVADLPPDLLARHFLRGTGANAGKVAVRPGVRDLVTFRQINFTAAWPIRGKFDIIFCRNAMIYFDREGQRRLLARFAAHLEPDGFLIVGHSENLYGVSDDFAPLGQTVYRLRTAPPAARPMPPAARPVAPTARLTPPPAPPTPADPEHTIVLGDVKATRGPAVLKTLLGSCVSACVYDPQTGVGGMNHFSLPGVSDAGVCARYGAHAMELLVTAVMKQGGDRSRLRAKVFGGAKVLNLASERLNVGSKNAAFVLEYLEAEGIPVAARCLGGTTGLLVRFNPHTGQARAKPLAGRELTGVVRSEETFGRALLDRVAAPADDRITLF
ncbi:MAG TPA: CheR family methyltransferase [Urbifossiella sp.]|nr:CheR family methyltransferase [Urbifossiella sp.]